MTLKIDATGVAAISDFGRLFYRIVNLRVIIKRPHP